MNTTTGDAHSALLYDRQGHLTELAFDRYLYDPDDPGLRAEVDRHLLGCEPCRAVLAAIRAEDDAVELTPLARDADLVSLADSGAGARRRRTRLLAGAGVVAMAALALLLARPWQAPPDDGIRLRGGSVQLQIFIDDGAGASHEVTTGDPVMAGQRFGFKVATAIDGHLMIVGVDAEQQPYVCYPQTTKRSVPLPAGGPITLDEAMAFDDVLGAERILAVLCDTPFGFGDLAPRLATLGGSHPGQGIDAVVLPRLIDECEQAEIILQKVSRAP